MTTKTSVEARSRFGQLLDQAQRAPVTITRRGRPVAVLVAIEPFEARPRQQLASLVARQAVAAFRGAGRRGAVEQLLADRRADA